MFREDWRLAPALPVIDRSKIMFFSAGERKVEKERQERNGSRTSLTVQVPRLLV